MKAFRDLFLICLISNFAKITLACGGYGVKLNSLQNCNPNNVIKADQNFSVRLDKKCNIIPKGCATVTKPIKTFNVHYTLNKPPIPTLDGDVNVCEICEVPEVSSIISAFALPTKCPVKPAKFCYNGSKKYNIGKYRMHLGMAAGDVQVKLDGTHDTGKSCVQISISIFKQ